MPTKVFFLIRVGSSISAWYEARKATSNRGNARSSALGTDQNAIQLAIRPKKYLFSLTVIGSFQMRDH